MNQFSLLILTSYEPRNNSKCKIKMRIPLTAKPAKN